MVTRTRKCTALRYATIVVTTAAPLLVVLPAAPTFAEENWLLEWNQPAEAGDREAREGPPAVRIRAGVFGDYTFETEIDENANGDVSVFRAGAGFQISSSVFDQAQLGVDFLYEFADYDFSGPNTFLAGTNDPFSELHLLSIGTRLLVPVDEQWSWAIGVGGQFAGESDVDVSDAGSVAGLVYARYQVDPNLSVGIGVIAGTRIEDDEFILPTFDLDWKIDESWRLRLTRPFLTLGPRAELTYQLSDETTIGVGFMYRNERYRLDDDSIRRSSVVEETRMPVFLNLVTQPSDNFTIAVEGGVQAFQEFQIETREGKSGREFDVDPAPFAGIRLIWTF